MISLPIVVNNEYFKWQLMLWWWNQKLVYGSKAVNKSRAIVISKNFRSEATRSHDWLKDIPHVYCDGASQDPIVGEDLRVLDLPLNIQYGVREAIKDLPDEQIIEILDGDMFHLRAHPKIVVRDDMLLVSDIYENWHLKSLTIHRPVIERYFENGGRFYNGGFVPIVGKVKTFRKIMYEWIAIHRDILKRDDIIETKPFRWWGGMFALQAACEKAKVTMIADDTCYIVLDLIKPSFPRSKTFNL